MQPLPEWVDRFPRIGAGGNPNPHPDTNPNPNPDPNPNPNPNPNPTANPSSNPNPNPSPSPNPNPNAKAHYSGYLLKGAKFDSSYERRKTLGFDVGTGRVIKGWDEALLDMKVGSRRSRQRRSGTTLQW